METAVILLLLYGHWRNHAQFILSAELLITELMGLLRGHICCSLRFSSLFFFLDHHFCVFLALSISHFSVQYISALWWQGLSHSTGAKRFSALQFLFFAHMYNKGVVKSEKTGSIFLKEIKDTGKKNVKSKAIHFNVAGIILQTVKLRAHLLIIQTTDYWADIRHFYRYYQYYFLNQFWIKSPLHWAH